MSVNSAAGRSGASEPLFDDDHADYRESFRTFLTREVVPSYPDWRARRRIPRELLRVAGLQGYLGMRVPEEHGGAGVDDLRFGIIVGEEAMLAGAPALALALVTHNDVAVPAIIRGAPADALDAWLPGLASGDTLATVVDGNVVLGEDGRLRGDAQCVVAGVDADLLVVVATPAGSGGSRRLAAITPGAAGVDVVPADPAIGLDAAGLATVRFEGADGFVALGPADELELDHALMLAVTALAGSRAALRATLDYVADRKAFGQPIAAFQNTRRALAAVAAEITAGAALVEAGVRRRMACALDSSAAASTGLFCSELFARAVDAGVQLHGGYGYVMEYEIAHAYADARFWQLTGGGSERLLDVIAATVFA